MAYITPSPGNSSYQVTVKLDIAPSDFANGAANTSITTNAVSLPALQNITINASNDIFTWSQLDSSAKKSIATTSTNSMTMNIVVDNTTFFGTTLASTTGNVAVQGLLGLSRNKQLINFSVRADGSDTTYIKGQGYITGVAPAVTAEQPVWVSPLNIAVTGEFVIAATETLY